MAGQTRRRVGYRAKVEVGGLQLVPGRQREAPGPGRIPGRCPPRRVEAMMQRQFLLRVLLHAAGHPPTETGRQCRLQLEPTGQQATAAPLNAGAIPPAFKAPIKAVCESAMEQSDSRITGAIHPYGYYFCMNYQSAGGPR